ncbi:MULTISPECIES: hypothetical protein [Nisaea]|uniref:hypothetical protein n=1 Tax=Nisaea TaxID=390876 RepID=UPI0004172353|nr:MULTISPECIES: hypothetical protein [Nisaea]
MNRIERKKVSALVGLRKRVPIGIGHNMGPPLSVAYNRLVWRKAIAKAWEPPADRLILQRRLKRAKELGMTYREYMLEILERGRHL